MADGERGGGRRAGGWRGGKACLPLMSMPCGDGKDALGARAALRTLGVLCTLASCPHQAAAHPRYGVQGPQRGGHGRRRVQSAGATGSPYAARADVVTGAEVMRCSAQLHTRLAPGEAEERKKRRERERERRFLVASYAACSILRVLTQWGATLVIITTRGSLAQRGPFLLLLFFSLGAFLRAAGKERNSNRLRGSSRCGIRPPASSLHHRYMGTDGR
jgi:hypothetical protein